MRYIAHGTVSKKTGSHTSASVAAKKFFDVHGVWPDEVEDRNSEFVQVVAGGCEACGQPIFEGDAYRCDSEGVSWHLKCPKP